MEPIISLVKKVRAIYYEKDKGLFLIKTNHSRRVDAWTTPGGEIYDGESPEYALRRLSLQETGVEPTLIAEIPFFIDRYALKNKEVESLAYDVNFNFRRDPWMSRLEHCFAKQEELRKMSLTVTMRQIVGSDEFRELVNSKF